jgi:hypothetical protein
VTETPRKAEFSVEALLKWNNLEHPLGNEAARIPMTHNAPKARPIIVFRQGKSFCTRGGSNKSIWMKSSPKNETAIKNNR